jgi:hypothetical protein
MIFGLAPASKDSNMTLNIVFSFGFSCNSCLNMLMTKAQICQLTSTASSAATAAGAAAWACAGIAISWIFSRD